jgi:toxin ParE1/3/4
MAVRLQYAAGARGDLADIRSYLRREGSPAIAQRMVVRLRRAVAAAQAMPQSGAPRPEFGEHCRFVIERPYVIYYACAGDVMTVLRILHAARDRDQIMGED